MKESSAARRCRRTDRLGLGFDVDDLVRLETKYLAVYRELVVADFVWKCTLVELHPHAAEVERVDRARLAHSICHAVEEQVAIAVSSKCAKVIYLSSMPVIFSLTPSSKSKSACSSCSSWLHR